jgi:hypothetical protein
LALSIAMMVSSSTFCLNENKPAGDNMQKATLSGKVVDKQTGESLAGVLVSIKESGLKVYTDFDGTFSFYNVEPGAYTVEVKYISYTADESQKVICSAGYDTQVNIEIKSN